MNRNLIAAAAVFCFAALSPAGPQDPAIGSNRYHTAIAAASTAPDVDDYGAPFVAGEKLTVTIDADKTSALRPHLSLVRPDGTVLDPTVVVKNTGKRVSLTKYLVPTTGKWRVRVSGADGTEGAYSIVFKVTAVAATKTRKPLQVPSTAVVTFEGVAGGLLDLTLSWKDKNKSVGVESILDPNGAPVPGFTQISGKKSDVIRKFPLTGGDGTFTLNLRSASATASCSMTLRVTPQGRPSSNKKAVELSADEPFLSPVAAPIRGVRGTLVQIDGKNFSTTDPPTVLFDGVPAAATVLGAGVGLSVLPPDGILEGTVVSVAVIAKDGQYAMAPSYFVYVLSPSIQNLVNLGDMPVRSGPKAGGGTLVLRGAGFEAGQTVHFGLLQATVLSVSLGNRMEVVVPGSATAGSVSVFVTDEFGRSGQSSFTYTYQ